jgi:hypothetical protein
MEATPGHPTLPDRPRDAASVVVVAGVGAQDPFELSGPAPPNERVTYPLARACQPPLLTSNLIGRWEEAA